MPHLKEKTVAFLGLSQAQIRAMRSAYICGLQGGYSDTELYSTFYAPTN